MLAKHASSQLACSVRPDRLELLRPLHHFLDCVLKDLIPNFCSEAEWFIAGLKNSSTTFQSQLIANRFFFGNAVDSY